MATLKDSWAGTSPWQQGGFAYMDGTTDLNYQAWTPSIGYTCEYVKLALYAIGSPTGTLTARLKACDANHKPTGSTLASASIDASTVTTGYSPPSYYTFTWGTAYNLTAGTEYCVTLENTANTASDYATMATDNTSPPGYGGYSTNGGSSWTATSTYNSPYQIYGTPLRPIDKTYSKKLVAIGNSEVWYELTAGTMIELTAANGDIDTSQPLEAFEAYEKVFITNGTNKKVVDFGNTKIATADVGANPPDFATILTGGTSGAKMIVDYITALSGACTIYGKRIPPATFSSGETVTGTDDDGNAISFTTSAAETAPPHWYNWTPFGNDTTFGSIPDQVNAGCSWRGRGVVCADKYYPHQWYMTRQGGNMWDFNYISNDKQSPVAGGGDPDVPGQVGDIIVVPIPYDRDHLLFGCANSIYCMFGDPVDGGTLDKLDIPGGILGTRAWCKDRNGSLYMLVSTGLIRIPKGFGAFENLTEETYPDFINDLAFNPSTHRIVMGYDKIKHGVKIVKVTLATGANTGWWYDLKIEGLFPESYASTEHGIFSMFDYEATNPTYRKLLLGCNNGYIYKEDSDNADDTLADDSAQAVDSYITFGPIKLGAENREGKVNNLVGVLAGGGSSGSETDSNDAAFKIWTELSADRISERFNTNSGQKISGTIKAPGRWRGNQFKRSIRGMYAGIRIGNNTAGEIWGLEKLLLDVKRGGKLR